MKKNQTIAHRTSKDLICQSASALKNSFGAVIKSAQTNGAVAITRHKQREFVILPASDYDDLVHQVNGDTEVDLKSLEAKFDVMFEQMQSPEYNEGMDKAYLASSEELGRSAVKQALKK